MTCGLTAMELHTRVRVLEAELRRCNPILAAAEARAERAEVLYLIAKKENSELRDALNRRA